ncbi:MAG TPA: sodium:solute symporter family protein [Bacteroidales bacterium]|nr:sodium:solute symporter family protein [Bacteroidales bacterium]
MNLHVIDLGIILLYLVATIFIGYWVSKRASKNIQSYFLGGNTLPWYLLGISNASGMFDIAGTMLLVYWLAVYGLKSIWIPWLWPVFNQIFLMVFLSAWLRRSNVMTGAEWIRTRFGQGKAANLSHIIVVLFALVSVIGFLSYGFKGIGKFATSFLPDLVTNVEYLTKHPQINVNLYALILMAITTFYVVKGGMFSVVITEVIQYGILTISSIAIGIIAVHQVAPGALDAVIPEGWKSMWFGHTVGLDWNNLSAAASPKLHAFNDWITKDGYSMFGLFFIMMLFKGIFVAAAGPAPNYDMQRVLATKSPKEAAKMSSLVNVVLNPARYFMIAGLTILALVNFDKLYTGSLTSPDFESILPEVLATYVPVGLLGFLMAGLLAAFMSNFAATVNAAPAYIVNDIYKRYINPNASEKRYVRMSYAASLLIVIIGVTVGFFVTSINNVVLWITAALWGGYTAPNVLKWYWWRFNGYGYFWGMLSGIVAALVLPMLNLEILHQKPLLNNFSMNAFPVILLISAIGSILGTLLTPAEDDETLKKFYKTVRPWGFWKPIHRKVVLDDPAFEGNRDFWRDMFNIIIGVAWQISLMAFPVFLVLREWTPFFVSTGVMIVTSVILKFNWWNKLKD